MANTTTAAWWWLIPSIIISAACGSSRPAVTDPTPTTHACRTYATQWVSTSSFGEPVSSSATFSAADRVYTESSPAGSGQIVRRTVYATVADFIDEAGVFGRFLYLRAESCASTRNCVGGLPVVQTPAYDNQRRQTGWTLQIGGVTFIVETYAAWDGRGRPTAGSRSQPGICPTVPLSVTYDEAARTITSEPVGPLPGFSCLGVYYPTQQTYDADGNLVGESGSAGGTSTTTTRAIGATARICE